MAITIPNVFVAGTRIESAPVNANFAAMSNALDKTGDTLTGNLVVGTGITIDGLDISTVPQSGGTFNPNGIVFTNIILGAATTSGIRLDLESGTLAVREGDDSAYGPMLASVYNVPTGGSVNFNAGSAALTWDTTESTANLALSANVDYKLGAQELVRCVNRTGTAIAKGKAVYIVGAHGNRPQIALADASDESTASTTLGITAESIADTAEGFVCISGMLRGLNTNSLTEGQIVWLSETAGELTSTRPTQPAHGVFMGLCVRQQPGTSGILYISVVNGLELEELHDVLITTPSANQILKRNSGNTLWENSSGAALTKTDDTNVTLTLGGSASTALVNAASLTLGWTGQLAVGRGGTGASTLTGYVKGSGTAALTASSTIPNTDITGLGTLSTQNASSVSISGGSITGITDLAIADGGTGASTAQGAINALAGATTSGQYLRGNGTNVVMSAIQAGDVPTLNQNTTGTAAGLSATLAVSSGGTGQTSYTDGQLLIGNTATTSLSKATLTAGSGVTITNGNGSITIAATGSGGTVTSVGATSPVASSGGTTPTISLNSAYGDTLNPYGSKTANYVLAAPNGTAGTPSFRALVAADIPTLNQNTTGTAAGLSSTLAVASGGTGQTTYTNGQLLIGNSTGNTLTKATLTAGSGISITNGSGSITIASTGVTSVSGTGTVNGLTLSGTVTTTGNLTLSGTVDSMSALAGSETAPSIAASGDTNTGIFFPAADTIAVTTGGVERLRIDGTNFTSTNASAANQFDLTSGVSAVFRLTRSSDDPNNSLIVQRKSRGTPSAPTAVASGDLLGINSFQGYGGTNWRTLVTVRGELTTYTSDTDMTSHLTFSTTNASSAAVERMRLTGFGDLAIATNRKFLLDGVLATGDTYITEASANNIAIYTGGSERLRLDGSGNVGVNVTSFGTSAAGVLGLKNGTEPTTGPADTVQIYSVDRSAGNTIPAIYTEGTGVTSAGITSTTVTTKIAIKVNGTIYYLLATTNAT